MDHPRAAEQATHPLEDQGDVDGGARLRLQAVALGVADDFLDVERHFADERGSGDDDLGETSARLGHPEAMLLRAEAAEESGDLAEAAALRDRAENPSTPLDLLSRAVMHLRRREEAEARPWLERAAHLGEPWAMVLLAEFFPTEAAEAWWERAAKLGIPYAMTRLGVALTDHDPGESSMWLRRAAEQEHTAAIRILAARADTPDEAEGWLLKAAHLHDNESIFQLAYYYFRQRDLDQAETWARRIVNQTRAKVLLSFISETRGDTNQQLEWLNKAAEYNDPTGILARGYYDWEGGNLDQARTWWNRLLDLDSPEARTETAQVGWLLAKAGETDQAEMWFRAANLTRRETLQLADSTESQGDPVGAEIWRRQADTAERDLDDEQ